MEEAHYVTVKWKPNTYSSAVQKLGKGLRNFLTKGRQAT
jgi:hypothetical protein